MNLFVSIVLLGMTVTAAAASGYAVHVARDPGADKFLLVIAIVLGGILLYVRGRA